MSTNRSRDKRAEMVSKTGADVEIAKILVHNRSKKREGIDESLFDRSVERHYRR